MKQKDILLEGIRTGMPLSLRERIRLTFLLCGPAILAQIASTLLQFIDASMVGSLGAGPSASIGLVSTSIWLIGGFCIANGQGFSVQVAHAIGANDFAAARNVLRQGLAVVICFSVLLAIAGLMIADPLPPHSSPTMIDMMALISQVKPSTANTSRASMRMSMSDSEK